VLPRQVNAVFDLLYNAGLNPVGAPVFATSDEDEGADGQDEIRG
jgi:hypothetical protein